MSNYIVEANYLNNHLRKRILKRAIHCIINQWGMITNIRKTPFGCSITAIQVKTLANA